MLVRRHLQVIQLLDDEVGNVGAAAGKVCPEAMAELGETSVADDQELLGEGNVAGREDIAGDTRDKLEGEREGGREKEEELECQTFLPL